MTVTKAAGSSSSSSSNRVHSVGDSKPAKTAAPPAAQKTKDGFEASRGVQLGAVASRDVKSASTHPVAPLDVGGTLRQAGGLLEKGSRLLEQNGVSGATQLKEAGQQLVVAGRSLGAAQSGSAPAVRPLADVKVGAGGTSSGVITPESAQTGGVPQGLLHGAQTAYQAVTEAAGAIGRTLSPVIQQGLDTVKQGMQQLLGLGTPSGTVTPAQGLSPASAEWVSAQTAKDPMGAVTYQAMATPGTPMNQVLNAAGVDVTTGVTVQHPPVNGLPQIPEVVFSMTPTQLAAAKAGPPPFDLPCLNSMGVAGGQIDNRGMRTSESFTKGDETLWRMSVRPDPNHPGNFLVGFYGEAVPKDSVGAAFHVLTRDANGVPSGFREGADRRVGTSPAEFAAWAGQGWAEANLDPAMFQ